MHPTSPFDRRRFLTRSAAWLAAGSIVTQRCPRPLFAAPVVPIVGKDRRLIVHKAQPFEIETPLDLLREHGLTPIESLFVRNNQAPDWAATLDPYPARKPWQVEFAGQIEFPRVVTLADLQALPQVEHEIVLQCSGNGRALFSQAAAVKGSPWRHGAMGNVKFRGPTVRSIFEKFDVRPHAAAKFATAEGNDSPGKPGEADFEHSLPLSDVLDRSMLALELNGRPLPAVHGGPVRLVTPGYYGTMHVKWLSRIRFETHETANHHQVKRYRTPLRPIEPGSEFDYGLENSEPNWNMRIKSVIFGPTDGATLPGGRGTLRGVAWNDGTARIDAVEYSPDGGRTWRRCEVERPASRYAWHPFQAELALPPGKHELMCRAIDTLGRTQPTDGAIDWNPAGYGWHGADRVTVVCSS
jgi:sulfite oxidase